MVDDSPKTTEGIAHPLHGAGEAEDVRGETIEQVGVGQPGEGAGGVGGGSGGCEGCRRCRCCCCCLLSVLFAHNPDLTRLTICHKVYPRPDHLRLGHDLLVHEVVPLVPVDAILLSPDQMWKYVRVSPVLSKVEGGEAGDGGDQGQ